MKLDMHVHTEYSYDSVISIEELVKQCKAKNIMPCITDHNTTKAWNKIKDLSFIPGEEISTDKGDVIGLFIQETIKPGNVLEVIDKIREQGGIVYIPHPHDIFRKGVQKKEIIEKADIVEVINAKCLPFFDEKALKTAKELGKLMGAGSDAHTPKDIGNAYVEIEDMQTKEELFKALKKGKVWIKKRTGIWSRVESLKKKLISLQKTLFSSKE